jgi:hypothetical protein
VFFLVIMANGILRHELIQLQVEMSRILKDFFSCSNFMILFLSKLKDSVHGSKM